MIRTGQPSRATAQRHLLDLRDALEAMRDGSMARMESVAWPAGLDRTVLHALPLEVRTRNCLQRERLMEGDNPLTVQELLRVPNFGRKSLQDLLFTVEDFLNECIRIGSADSREGGEPNERTSAAPNESATPTTRAQAPRTTWESAGRLLGPLLATATELHGAKTFADTDATPGNPGMAPVRYLFQSLLVTCRLHEVDAYTYLINVLQQIRSVHPANRAVELIPADVEVSVRRYPPCAQTSGRTITIRHHTLSAIPQSRPIVTAYAVRALGPVPV